jgi:hypothetical protein
MGAKRAYDSGRMEQQKPEQKHCPQQSCGPSVPLFNRHADACDDEGRPRKIRPEQPSGNPRRHEAGDNGENEKMVYAEHHRRSCEQVGTGPDQLIENTAPSPKGRAFARLGPG